MSPGLRLETQGRTHRGSLQTAHSPYIPEPPPAPLPVLTFVPCLLLHSERFVYALIIILENSKDRNLNKIFPFHFLSCFILIGNCSCKHLDRDRHCPCVKKPNQTKPNQRLVLVKTHTAQSQLSYYLKKKKKSVCLKTSHLLQCLNSLKELHQNVSCNLASDQLLNII